MTREALKEAIEARLERARRMQRMAQDVQLTLTDPKYLGEQVPGWYEWPEIEQLCAALAAACERDLALVEEHHPVPFRPEFCGGQHVVGGRFPCDVITELAHAYEATEEVAS